jgi:hypothetical protein
MDRCVVRGLRDLLRVKRKNQTKALDNNTEAVPTRRPASRQMGLNQATFVMAINWQNHLVVPD